MWLKQLPPEVRTAIAGESMEGDNFEKILIRADNVFQALKPPAGIAATKTVSKPSVESESAEIAAVGRGRGGQGRGRGNQRGRGRGRGNRQGNQTQKHPDNPPDQCCPQHTKYGRSAYYCMNIVQCPWRDVVNPPTNSTNKNDIIIC